MREANIFLFERKVNQAIESVVAYYKAQGKPIGEIVEYTDYRDMTVHYGINEHTVKAHINFWRTEDAILTITIEPPIDHTEGQE